MTWVHNFHGSVPNNEIAVVIVINLVFPILAFLAVCLRFYVRRRTNCSPWVDDYAVLASAILTLARGGLVIAQTRWGLGLNHTDLLPPDNFIPFSKIQYSYGPLYSVAVLGFKISLLTWYLRIGGVVMVYRHINFVVIVAVIINQILLTFIFIFTCMPVAKTWNPSIEGDCINKLAFYYAIAATSIAFDLIIIILPLPVLWKLSLKLKPKIMLTCIFAIGFLITIIQIIRILSVGDLKLYVDSKTAMIWTTIEISLGVIIACVLTYGPLVKDFASTVTSRRQRTTTYSDRFESPRGNKLARNPPTDRSINTIHGSDSTRNTTTVSSKRQRHWIELNEEREEHVVTRVGPWHIHVTTEILVEEAST